MSRPRPGCCVDGSCHPNFVGEDAETESDCETVTRLRSDADDLYCRLHSAVSELADLAAAVESSGVVCPVCRGRRSIPLGKRGTIEHGWHEPCPRCSVEMREHVECRPCRGEGAIDAQEVQSRILAALPCPACHGLGHRPGPLHAAALGVVYPRKDAPE